MTTQQWIETVRSLGLPTVFTFVLLWIIWRALKAVAPLFEGAYKKHVELVDDLKGSVSKQTELLTVIHEESQGNNAALYHAADALEEIAPKARKEAVERHTSKMRAKLIKK